MSFLASIIRNLGSTFKSPKARNGYMAEDVGKKETYSKGKIINKFHIECHCVLCVISVLYVSSSSFIRI